MKQTKKRSHHFLPICYQKPFTGSNGLAWVQFLNKDRPPIPLSPISVGVMNRFYTCMIRGMEDDSVEDFFDSYVESSYAPIADRAKQCGWDFALLPEDVPALLKFVASQVVRTAAHRECVNEQAGMAVNSRIFIRNMADKMKAILAAWRANTPDVILATSKPHIGSYFITGDHPVLTFSAKTDYQGVEAPFNFRSVVNIETILNAPDSGFAVPLSPYICIAVLNGGTGAVSATGLDRAFVSKINHDIYGQCIQFVAARDAETLGFHQKRQIMRPAG